MKILNYKGKKQSLPKGTSILRYSMVAIFFGLLVSCSLFLSPIRFATGGNANDVIDKTKNALPLLNMPIRTYSKNYCLNGRYNTASIQRIGAFFLKETDNQKTFFVPYIFNGIEQIQFLEFDEQDEMFYVTCLEYKKNVSNYIRAIPKNLNRFMKVGDFEITKNDNVEKQGDVKVEGYEVYKTKENYDVLTRDVLKSLLEKIGLPTQQTEEATTEEKKTKTEPTPDRNRTGKWIIISLSKGLDDVGVAGKIKKAVITLLEQNENDKFDVFIIETGRKLKKVELNDLKEIAFSADDLRAMDDLVLLDEDVRTDNAQAVGKIVYFTDNHFLPDTWQQIPSNQLGVIKVWCDLYNIDFHVFTTGKVDKVSNRVSSNGCAIWKKANVSCEQIERNSNINESLIKTFQEGMKQ